MDNEKIQHYTVVIFKLLLISAAIGNIVSGNWLNIFTSLLALILIYLPNFLSERNYIYIPSALQFIMILFIFAALYMGELREYYLRFWWWDLLLHTLAGVIFGFIGYIIVYILNKEEKVNIVLSPLFISIFAVGFSVTVGVIWEIFEFSMDIFFKLNMQKSGLVDTMLDLIVVLVGAILTATIGFIYLKTKRPSRFEAIISKLIEKNKDILNKY